MLRSTPVLLALTLLVGAVGCGEQRAGRTQPATTQAQGQTEPASGTDEVTWGDIPGIVAEVEPSAVAVLVEGPFTEGEGSGVIWDADGLIVTNAHVVEGAVRIRVVLASGERLEARIRAADELTDIAVLQVDREGLPAARFATELPERGELVLAFGNPLGFENTVSEGIVSGLHRAIPSGGRTPALVDLIQTSAPISPGNSGGALVDADGEVVGVNVAYIPPEEGAVSLGFAIPAPTVKDVVAQLLEQGNVDHAFLGINTVEVTPQIAERLALPVEEGVAVLEVAPDSPADRAGVQAADVIVSLGEREIRSSEDLYSALRDHAPGDAVTVTLYREGERRDARVTLGERL